MQTISEIVPVSGLRTRQKELLDGLSEGPVVLTQHGRAAAVLVSPEQWNRIIETLEDLSDSLDAMEMKARIASGQEPVSEWADVEGEVDAPPA